MKKFVRMMLFFAFALLAVVFAGCSKNQDDKNKPTDTPPAITPYPTQEPYEFQEGNAKEFSVSGVFSDNMVIQRDQEIVIYGTAPESENGKIVNAFLKDLKGSGGPDPAEFAGDVAALVAGFVAGIGRIAIAHPWLPPLWVREVLCEGGALRDVLFEHVGPAIPRMMATRFAAAQADGGLNPDLDPRLLMVSLVGLTLFPIAGAPVWRRLFAADPSAGAEPSLDFETLRRHTLALLDRGLELKA